MVSDVSSLRGVSSNSLACNADRSHTGHPPICDFQCQKRVPWKRDVALEISVDVENVPATILLSGTLDGATAVNLVALIVELIGEGFRSFELRTSALCVANEPGLRALDNIHRLVRRSGGKIAWDGSTANHPFLAEKGRLDRVAPTNGDQ
jgi:hypothetical protein